MEDEIPNWFENNKGFGKKYKILYFVAEEVKNQVALFVMLWKQTIEMLYESVVCSIHRKDIGIETDVLSIYLCINICLT